jgi:two-component system chemotaxis response regulator CheY
MKLKALVVDDSGIMRKMVMKLIGEAKLAEFEFVEATDGADALVKFNAKEIDIAFVDWNMPKMTGIEFVREVRAHKSKITPLVMVTSEQSFGKVQEAIDSAGADGYICKPFTADDLRKRLTKLIEKAGALQTERTAQPASWRSKVFA